MIHIQKWLRCQIREFQINFAVTFLICVLCGAFCSHIALPRAKGMHQPRDSAVLPLKTNNHSGSGRPAHEHTEKQTQRGGTRRKEEGIGETDHEAKGISVPTPPLAKWTAYSTCEAGVRTGGRQEQGTGRETAVQSRQLGGVA